jgi:hypothetical protein
LFGSAIDVPGVTTVTSLDVNMGVVGLRVKTTEDNGERTSDLIDLVVTSGGVVISETERLGYVYVTAIPKDIGTPSGLDVWTLQHL